MKYVNSSQAKRETGLSYLGTISQSAKTAKNEKYGYYTYTLYLAPAKQSGYEVCPNRTPQCTAACLAFSGRNRFDLGNIDKARIKKTRLFFEQREFFCAWLFDDIRSAQKKADRDNFKLSVRLNGTSDISPLEFVHHGKNVLESFPDVIFYDYTKVVDRLELPKRYKNYSLTFSYTGKNTLESRLAIESGSNVAVVFSDASFPDHFLNAPVINGDESDLRFLDPSGSVVGLKYKRSRYKIDFVNNPFIVNTNQAR